MIQNKNIQEDIRELTTIKKSICKNKIIKNKKTDPDVVRACTRQEQAEKLKSHFDKFIKEYCEINENNKCLALDILGAYRMWNKKTDVYTRKNLTTYLKNNFDLNHEYSSEYNTKFHYYIGIKPKEFKIEYEDNTKIPYYEEFILSECKFDYTYRTTKTILYNEFRHWVAQKYPTYIFSKEDQTHMESYLNRTFVNCKKVHINGGTNGYYGLQLKSDTTEKLGISLSRRKKVYKINIENNEIIETYDSLYLAAIKVNINEQKLSELVLNNTIIDDEYIYSYNIV